MQCASILWGKCPQFLPFSQCTWLVSLPSTVVQLAQLIQSFAHLIFRIYDDLWHIFAAIVVKTLRMHYEPQSQGRLRMKSLSCTWAEWKRSKLQIAISTGRLPSKSQPWFEFRYWNHDWTIFHLAKLSKPEKQTIKQTKVQNFIFCNQIWKNVTPMNVFCFIAPKASAEGACILSKMG